MPTQRARTDLGDVGAYTRNIEIADRRLETMISALKEFESQAGNLSAALLNFGAQGRHQAGEIVYDDSTAPPTAIGLTEAEMDTAFQDLQDTAADLFPILEDLLNTQDGARYLFAGDQVTTAPYQDGTVLDGAMSGLLTQWKDGTLDTQELTAALDSRATLSDATVGYAPEIASGTAGGVTFRPDEGVEIRYTTLANERGFRDVLVAMAYVKSETLGPIADVVDPSTGLTTTEGAPGNTLAEMQNNFYAALEFVGGMLQGGIESLRAAQGNLEGVRARLGDYKTQHQMDETVLNQIVANAENADISTVAVRLQTLNTQLNVSLSATAMMQETSLLKYL